ncbi:NADPH-dependent FMN reductase [Robertkochia solimangrovi]|uniref:NADPH-dependent FMN reductase n=1 Tax=Robertkochia solimangrovi TaxID=2213046 RepID=UPI00117E00AF|nr:NAD(P)H-dependent oxidoreductase [Robertkochia solimangrovi]TRZ44961.1 NADPH-dependent FMN reductase [Robertkochia solimangrovi]
MKRILAFAGSNSSTSINYELVSYTVSLIDDYEIQLLNMSKMPFPLYSADMEKAEGFKNSLIELREDIIEADGIIIGVNEHNRNLSAYFKNLIDWLSRLDRKFLDKKPVMLTSTSDGDFGGSRSLKIASETLPRFGAEIVSTFSLPNYSKNFSEKKGIITDETLKEENKKALDQFLSSLI